MPLVRALLVAVAVCACTAAPLQATAVVAFRTPTRIILASDSLVQTFHGATIDRRLTCKVTSAGRWWTSLSGYMGTPTLDVQAQIAAALASTRTLDAARDALMTQVYPQVRAAFEQQRQTPAFRQMFTAGQLAQSIVVAGTNADDSTLRLAVFIVVLDSITPLALTPAFLQCPGHWCPTGEVEYGASIAAGPLMALLTSPLAPWVARRDATAARRIITSQIQAAPTEVAGPIDVLQITSAGAAWVDRDPASACP